ncbi:hypothetical protein ACWPKS_03570 [Coraliomargarita sp. W4R72]
MLALNVAAFSYIDLIFRPLEFNQVAPVGFLLLSKFCVQVGGLNELSLRLVPLLHGIGLVYLSYHFANRLFKKNWFTLLAVAMFALCPSLIYYSNEHKQYILDAFWGVFCVYIYYKYLADELGIRALIVTGLLSILFSHPVCFVLAAIGFVEFSRGIKCRELRLVYQSLVASSTWLCFFALVFWISIRNYQGNDYLTSFWSGAFPPRDSLFPIWFQANLASIYEMTFVNSRSLGSVDWQNYSWSHTLGLAIITASCATCLLVRDKLRPLAMIFAVIILIHLAVSYLQLYPFGGRLLIYLLPFVILLIVGASKLLADSKHQWLRVSPSVLILILIFQQLTVAFSTFIKPTNYADMRSALSYISANQNEGDLIAISYWSFPAFFYYSTTYGFSPESCRIINRQNLSKDFVDAYEGNARVWALFSHRMNEVEGFLNGVTEEVDLLEHFEKNETAVYLFEFKESQKKMRRECGIVP